MRIMMLIILCFYVFLVFKQHFWSFSSGLFIQVSKDLKL